jgi:hypothetical protein
MGMTAAVSPGLIQTARLAVEAVSRGVGDRALSAQSAQLASQLYDAISIELSATPRYRASRFGLLSAALDQCRHATLHVDRPALMEAVLWSTLEILKSGDDIQDRTYLAAIDHLPPRRPKPQLRLIIGGRSDKGKLQDANGSGNN